MSVIADKLKAVGEGAGEDHPCRTLNDLASWQDPGRSLTYSHRKGANELKEPGP